MNTENVQAQSQLNNQRKEFNMKCPGCGYKYKVSLLRDYEVEYCSICGYFTFFKSFVAVEGA